MQKGEIIREFISTIHEKHIVTVISWKNPYTAPLLLIFSYWHGKEEIIELSLVCKHEDKLDENGGGISLNHIQRFMSNINII